MECQPIKDSSLKKSLERLLSRARATLDFSTGNPYFEEIVQCFVGYCDESELWNPQFPIVHRIPDDAGQEHKVWFDPTDACYYKLTHPAFFGLNVVYRDESDRFATPLQYLERWVLHNQLFGDAVEWLGCFRNEQAQISILIRQPAISGMPASDFEIDSFFKEADWLPFAIQDELAYFIPTKSIVVSDTHRGNLIKLPEGLLVPIDLRLQKVKGSLRQAVLNVLKTNP